MALIISILITINHLNYLLTKAIKISTIIGISFLLVQLFFVIYARFIPERFFCWAPFDEHSYYNIDVEIEGKSLSANEINARYKYRSEGWETRSMDNIFSLVKQYEDTYGKYDNADVKIIFTTNGHNESQWINSK